VPGAAQPKPKCEKLWTLAGASVGFGLAAAVCMACANYVINEWLDRESDKFHPTKSKRSAVQKVLRREIVLLEWAARQVATVAMLLVAPICPAN
jgi:4-hydroxybenzoate polyprenyltransferase